MKWNERACDGCISRMGPGQCTHFGEVHEVVGQLLVEGVGRSLDPRVVLLHGLVLREGLLRGLLVHHVTAHQGLRPARHGLCLENTNQGDTHKDRAHANSEDVSMIHRLK